MATVTALSKDSECIISPTSADWLHWQASIWNRPTFCLGALLSVAQEASRPDPAAAGARCGNRAQETRRAGDRQARVEVMAARAGSPRDYAQQRAGCARSSKRWAERTPENPTKLVLALTEALTEVCDETA